MTSRITLHAGPAAGFDQPFEMLAACHERVRRSLDLLQRLRAHVGEHGVDAQAQDAANDVLRYFDIAGPAHHEDEERHVLPQLRSAGEAAMAERLHADHVEMTQLWEGLRGTLQAWAQGSAASMDEVALQRYLGVYDAHLAIEDGQAFGIAAAGLDEASRTAMGDEMASRRRR